MSAEKGNAVAIGVSDETGKAILRTTTVRKRASSGNLDIDSEAEISAIIIDPRWQVENHMKQCEGTLDRRQFLAMAGNEPNPYIYHRCRVVHDTCVGTCRRRQGMSDRN